MSPFQVKAKQEIREIDFEEVKVINEIGRGNFYVYRAKYGEAMIAVKAMKLDKAKVKELREIQIHANLPPHEYVLSPIGVAFNPDRFQLSYICMELATQSLYQFMHESKIEPSFRQSTKWALQIASGMQHLHEHNVIHRDLKSPNILLFATGDIKLCDFGCAKPLEETAKQTQVTGTHRWVAPEIHKCAEAEINKACDVFSYGMVLYELYIHQVPFYHIKEGPQVTSLVQDNKRPHLPSSLPHYLQHLMQACWEHNFYDRPKFPAIVRAQETKEFTHEIKTPQYPEPLHAPKMESAVDEAIQATTPPPQDITVRKQSSVVRRQHSTVCNVHLVTV